LQLLAGKERAQKATKAKIELRLLTKQKTGLKILASNPKMILDFPGFEPKNAIFWSILTSLISKRTSETEESETSSLLCNYFFITTTILLPMYAKEYQN